MIPATLDKPTLDHNNTGILDCIFAVEYLLGVTMSEQAVIVHFTFGQTDLSSLIALEDKLIAAIESADVGEFDGNAVAADGSDGSLYMYGPDADRLFEVVRPVLASAICIQNAVATVRYGPPEDGVKERTVAIDKTTLD